MKRLAFYASVGKKFDDGLAQTFTAGCRRHGMTTHVFPTADWAGQVDRKADVGVVVGVKDKSGPIFKAYRAAGKHAVFIDKGYTRIRGGPLKTLYWRVSINTFQPLAYFRCGRPDHRWRALNIPITEYRPGSTVLFAGSSQKYCDWQGLGPATAYAERVLAEIRKYTDRPVVYRPKPSWKDAVPVDGYDYSPDSDKFITRLDEAHCLVTYGSNACFEALLNGVPSIVLGDGITRPVSSTTAADVEAPRMPNRDELYHLACDLSYCQWTLDEFANGTCWEDACGVFARLARLGR